MMLQRPDNSIASQPGPDTPEESVENDGRSQLPRLVLVDDDPSFRQAAIFELEALSFQVLGLANGDSLLDHLDGTLTPPDAIILDWYLDKETGIDILPRLQRRGIQIPVIFLTGAASRDHEISTFDLGAFDFIDKMRGMTVVARRINRILQMTQNNMLAICDELAHGHLTLRPKVSRALWKGEDVNLTVTEFNIVHLLVERAGEYVTYRNIYDCVRGSGFFAGSGEDGYRTNVRSSIKRIRSKFNALDPDFNEIQNFQAFGYQWQDPRTGRIDEDARNPEMGPDGHGVSDA
jgi:two-component system response regulator ChvI